MISSIVLISVVLGADHNCTTKMTGDFSHVTLVGHFMTDRGCESDGYLVDDQKVASRSDSAKALKSAGWVDKNKRVKLALEWLDAMDSSTLLPDHTETLNANGSVTITGWIQDPPGMRRERTKNKVEITFAEDGSFKSKELEHKTEKF